LPSPPLFRSSEHGRIRGPDPRWGRPALAVRPRREKDLRGRGILGRGILEARGTATAGTCRTRGHEDEANQMTDGEQPGPAQPIRVFLLDDHDVVPRRARDLRNAEPNITERAAAAPVEPPPVPT